MMGKIRIRALILDYGGVISQPQNPENVTNILHSLEQDHNGFSEVYFRQRGQYDLGQLSGEQYWTDILQHYGLNPDGFDIARLIQEDVKSWTQLHESMIQFITESRSQIHRLAMLSNMTRDTLAFMRKHYSWLELFDELYFSCELGIKKPDREFYETCLRKLELSPNECLFVDDSVKNVKGAVEAGMPAIQFRTFSEFMLELDEKYSLSR
jgi:putative hydrolase of the HAD superfamily